MKKTLTSIAAAAVLTASAAMTPALAQSSTATPASPAAPSAPAAPAGDAAKPMGNMAATPAAGSTAGGSYLTEQSQTQVSANDYIGKSIYNADNESIGDVNDLLFEQNGGLTAAVVGVGGFLGIGEKDVALPINKLTVTRDAKNNNEVRLTTTETADALKSAPEFKSLQDKQADQTTTSSTTPTPADGATNSSTAPSK